jgi:hypothetical protein
MLVNWNMSELLVEILKVGGASVGKESEMAKFKGDRCDVLATQVDAIDMQRENGFRRVERINLLYCSICRRAIALALFLVLVRSPQSKQDVE